MSDEPLLVGVDAGTTRVKAGVYDASGRVLASAAVPTPTSRPQPGRAEHDAEDLWSAAVAVLREVVDALDAPERIAGIAVASMAEAGVPLDAGGQPTHPVIAWHDQRSAAQAQRITEAVGAARAYAITGLRPQPIYGLCKIAWLAEHAAEAYARTHRWLSVADYLAYRLCGQHATDLSLATRTWALDLRARTWSSELLDAACLPASLFAPLVASGTALGPITDEAARATGLPAHTVVAAGGHDHPCGALAADVVAPGAALDSIGTAESLLLALAAPLDAGDDVVPRYSQGVHVAAERYYVATGIHAGGASIDWALRLVGAGRERDAVRDRDAVLAAAAAVPPGAHGLRFAPHLSLAGVVDGAPGALVGLAPDTDAATLVRAVIEGLAVAAHAALDALVAHSGLSAAPTVRVIGGGARNTLLLRVKSALAGGPLHRPDLTEATSLGAALLAGVGAGVFGDTAAAAAAVDLHLAVVEPDPADVAAYPAVVRQLRALHDLASPR